MSEPNQMPDVSTNGRRRSSGLLPAFDALHQHKRGSDAGATRRVSMSDQQSKGGIFHQLFHNNLGRNAGK
ncbi:conidiation-specific expression protein [Ophiocordyceps camponoti-floridani]|uniref:Conidiation-specific expression protein n=1 Tax=Ophiocordyceps camponoti-floridani TaxID=2030778 RepID=A0A8H4Q197_9HYPO|nr:conidiation-specific expression protein [Ophiocordyceps camponoti-floridani]